MSEERRRRRGERSDSWGARKTLAGGLLSRIRRVVAPRPARALVMERDGRLVCVDYPLGGERARR